MRPLFGQNRRLGGSYSVRLLYDENVSENSFLDVASELVAGTSDVDFESVSKGPGQIRLLTKSDQIVGNDFGLTKKRN